MAVPPHFVVIGHATRDLLPDGGWRLGGTVAFAALTAQRLGCRVSIVTSAAPDVLVALSEAVPGAEIGAVASASSTIFENVYSADGRERIQHVRDVAAPLAVGDVLKSWLRADIVLLAPVAREVDPRLAAAFPRAIVAATPQGWLRQWDASGLVRPASPATLEAALPHLRALILSREDLLPATHIPGATVAAGATAEGMPRDTAEADALIAHWAQTVPLVAVTRGPDGALLYRDGAGPESFAAAPARELDPTGAGDVFAAAFLCALHESGDPRAAAAFANRVAAYSVEHTGNTGIPTREALARRYGAR